MSVAIATILQGTALRFSLMSQATPNIKAIPMIPINWHISMMPFIAAHLSEVGPAL